MNALLSQFSSRLETVATETEAYLDTLLGVARAEGEHVRPPRLVDAMRYAMLGGGKRLRPFLAVETAALFDVPRSRALMAGVAIECIHGYSLVHDDLPAMDDDALRRGRPTVHKAFDEATAILAGDALLTFAFDVMARPDTHPNTAVRVVLIRELARAAGVGGMAGGQMLDLAAEGRFAQPRALPPDEIVILQAMKTGALIRYACRAGAILGEADALDSAAVDQYGTAIGQAFQIADDLLDIEGDVAATGKATRKDAAAGKATFVGALGIAGARERLKALIGEADAALAPFGDRAQILRDTARFISERRG